MKTNESTWKTANADAQQAAGNDQSLVLRYDYREQDFEHWPRPSELELARLAAQLARTEKIEPQPLVAEAWALYWESCRTLQVDHRRVAAYFAQEAELERHLDWPEPEPVAAIPMPKKFPVNHRQVEVLLLPKQRGRTADRAALIREYIFSQLTRTCLVVRPKLAAVSYWEMEADLQAQLRQKLKDEIDRRFEKFRNTVLEAEAYARFAAPFLEWHRRFIAAKKAAAARKRWAKAEAKAKAEAEAKQAADEAAAKVRTRSQKRRKKSLGGN